MFVKFNILTAIVLAFACTACGTSKLRSLLDITDTSDGKPRILFVNLIAKRDSLANRIHYELVETIAVEGKVKRSKFDKIEMVPGYILCSILNGDRRVLDELVLPGPLDGQYEYLDEDGNYKAGRMIEDEQEFTIRVNYIAGMKYLEISKIINKDSLKHISTINLLER